jgi:hypothetical protein
MIDLPPCPYCKGRDVKIGLGRIAGTAGPGQPPIGSREFYYAMCEFCECHTGPKGTPEEAAEVWRQVPPDFSGESKTSLWFPYRHPSDLH